MDFRTELSAEIGLAPDSWDACECAALAFLGESIKGSGRGVKAIKPSALVGDDPRPAKLALEISPKAISEGTTSFVKRRVVGQDKN
jgi:hypothetical protein